MSLLYKLLIFMLALFSSCSTYALSKDLCLCEQLKSKVLRESDDLSLNETIKVWSDYKDKCASWQYDLYISHIYYKFGRLDEAENFLIKKIKSVKYDTKELRFNLGLLYIEMKEFVKLRNLATNMKINGDKSYESDFLFGAAFFYEGRLKKAEFWLKNALLLDRYGIEANLLISILYKIQGFRGLSLFHWQRALKENYFNTIFQREITYSSIKTLLEIGDLYSLKEAKHILDLMKSNLENIEKDDDYVNLLSLYNNIEKIS